MSRTAIAFLVLSLGVAGCKSAGIEEVDSALTTKFGPTDLAKLGGELMDRIGKATEPWMEGKPTLAIADFRNTTDQPGLNKAPFYNKVETELFRMKRFDLKDHQTTEQLLKEAGFQQSSVFSDEQAAQMGKAARAHFLMWGDISLIESTDAEGALVKQYSLALKVTDVETHSIVYRDVAEQKIKVVR
ncbi:MAG: hypothetical protein AB1486_18345 [Planctomycetota bacterium]